MNKEKTYTCTDCGKVMTIAGDAPECCGKPMKLTELDRCTNAPHAEMVRTKDIDDPCDDGRKG